VQPPFLNNNADFVSTSEDDVKVFYDTYNVINSQVLSSSTVATTAVPSSSSSSLSTASSTTVEIQTDIDVIGSTLHPDSNNLQDFPLGSNITSLSFTQKTSAPAAHIDSTATAGSLQSGENDSQSSYSSTSNHLFEHFLVYGASQTTANAEAERILNVIDSEVLKAIACMDHSKPDARSASQVVLDFFHGRKRTETQKHVESANTDADSRRKSPGFFSQIRYNTTVFEFDSDSDSDGMESPPERSDFLSIFRNRDCSRNQEAVTKKETMATSKVICKSHSVIPESKAKVQSNIDITAELLDTEIEIPIPVIDRTPVLVEPVLLYRFPPEAHPPPDEVSVTVS